MDGESIKDKKKKNKIVSDKEHEIEEADEKARNKERIEVVHIRRKHNRMKGG